MLSVATAPLASSTRAFTRYVFSVQYHGGDFLGFSYQGRRGENCIVHKKQKFEADLRGIESVEGRIRRALDELVGAGNYANFQVSSRTDRGVHALRNTFQVDVRLRSRVRKKKLSSNIEAVPNQSVVAWCPRNLVDGLNFYLSRLSNYPFDVRMDTNEYENGMGANNNDSTRRQQSPHLQNQPLNRNITILSSAIAPTSNPNQKWPWDVRYTATRRTYAYRILYSYEVVEKGNRPISAYYHYLPFEHDRVWRIHDKVRKDQISIIDKGGLDIEAMNRAGIDHLVGTHDFTSFRGKGCQRYTPVVTLEDLWVGQERYHQNGVLSEAWRRKSKERYENGKENERLSHPQSWYLTSLRTPKTLNLITIVMTGKSFVYHQVRNMVACLVDVGRGTLQPDNVKEILDKKDRSGAPGMAPAKGLFLVDVEHGNLQF